MNDQEEKPDHQEEKPVPFWRSELAKQIFRSVPNLGLLDLPPLLPW